MDSRLISKRVLVIVLMVIMVISASLHTVNANDSSVEKLHVLSNYGPVSTPAKAQMTLDQLAKQLMAKNGGTIFITGKTTTEFKPVNNYQIERDGPGICLVDIRSGCIKVIPTHVGIRGHKWSGFEIDRVLNQNRGLGFWGQFAVAQIQNKVISGSSSIYQTLKEEVKAGKDVKVYPDSIEGFSVGARFCNYSAPKKAMFTVKSIGWDPRRKRHFFVTDLKHDIPKGGRIGTKNMNPALNIKSWFNADQQTAGVLGLHTKLYGLGDCFNFNNSLTYQSNIMSTPGDEGAVVSELESSGDLDSFRAVVESFESKTGTLVFKPGMVRAAKLSTSRPIINLNNKKWITQGHVIIVQSETNYKGVKYPTIWKGDVPHPGGLIQGSRDAPWDESVIGRYFAVDEDTEKYTKKEMSQRLFRSIGPGAPVRRWYRITEFKKYPDGTKSIRILQVRWNSVSAGSPNLFRKENYSFKNHSVPLKYIIAPGGIPYDISEGWVEASNSATYALSTKDAPRRLKITPNGDRGTSFDFEPNDPIVQAVGPDPHYPRLIRMVNHDYFPSILNQDMVQLKNAGKTARIGINFTSKVKNVKQLAKQKDGNPPYLTGIKFSTVMGVGIQFERPVTEAAMLMEQRDGNVQPIIWKHQGPGKRTSLAVNPKTGNMEISGGNLDLNRSNLQQTTGISGTKIPANNLRGINVPVKVGQNELNIKFPSGELDNKYAITISPNWLTVWSVINKNQDGFTIRFAEPAPQKATIDWLLIR